MDKLLVLLADASPGTIARIIADFDSVGKNTEAPSATSQLVVYNTFLTKIITGDKHVYSLTMPGEPNITFPIIATCGDFEIGDGFDIKHRKYYFKTKSGDRKCTHIFTADIAANGAAFRMKYKKSIVKFAE